MVKGFDRRKGTQRNPHCSKPKAMSVRIMAISLSTPVPFPPVVHLEPMRGSNMIHVWENQDFIEADHYYYS